MVVCIVAFLTLPLFPGADALLVWVCIMVSVQFLFQCHMNDLRFNSVVVLILRLSDAALSALCDELQALLAAS